MRLERSVTAILKTYLKREKIISKICLAQMYHIRYICSSVIGLFQTLSLVKCTLTTLQEMNKNRFIWVRVPFIISYELYVCNNENARTSAEVCKL